MKGTIEIKLDGESIERHIDMARPDPLERMVIVDSVVRALRIDPRERRVIGFTISAGGIDFLADGKVDQTTIDLSLLKNRKESRIMTLRNEILSECCTKKLGVTIIVQNGFQLKGIIEGFDETALLFSQGAGEQMIVFQNAISTIRLPKRLDLR